MANVPGRRPGSFRGAAGRAGIAGAVLGALLMRPGARYGRRGYGGDVGLSFRPNAPRMVTVLLSIVLTVAGLTATGVAVIGPVADLLLELDLAADDLLLYGKIALLASPGLLVLGSFFRGL